jgi:hypothetical protein
MHSGKIRAQFSKRLPIDFHVVFNSLWKDFGTRFAEILESLKHHRDVRERRIGTAAILLEQAAAWLSADGAVQADRLERQIQRPHSLTD